MASENEMTKLVRARGACKASVTSFAKYLEKFKDKISLEELEIIEISNRLGKIELVFDKFEGVQTELEGIIALVGLEKEYQTRQEFEDSYHSVVAFAKMLIKDTGNVGSCVPSVDGNGIGQGSIVHASQSVDFNSVKLPIISLPKFNGDLSTWMEFRDIFSSMINENSNLKPIQKYHYLRASLEGSAAQVIRSLEFSNDTYEIAYRTLCERYDNTRLLVHKHVKSLFALEPLRAESASKIRILVDTVSKDLNSLTQLKQPTEHWDTLVVYLVSTKLDNVTAREWEQLKSKDKLPTWEEFKDFLRSRADILDSLEQRSEKILRENNARSDYLGRNKGNFKFSGGAHSSKSLITNDNICAFCKENHFIGICEEFIKLSVGERAEKIKNLKLCLNCLKAGHFSKFCRTAHCKKCNRKHNVLLHADTLSERKDIKNESAAVALSSLNSNPHVLLSTVLVQVFDKNGRAYTARGILDSGSQSSFITEELCDKLSLEKSEIKINVAGLAENVSKINYKCNLKIRSFSSNFETTLDCLILPEITSCIPSVPINGIDIPKNIKLADYTYNKPGKISFLIGADIFYSLLCIGQLKLGSSMPILQKTKLGWLVSGPVNLEGSKKTVCILSTNLELRDQLSKFWEVEQDFEVKKKVWSKEEQLCEDNFVQTIKRNEDGRFIVDMPLKETIEVLGDSKVQAERRFYNLERKFKANPEFKETYVKFMAEYRDLGHMTEVPNISDDVLAYYMPHHGVYKEDSLTTRLRVVFDASASTTSGRSLNDIQMVGPVLQNDLLSLILKFRTHKYVVLADVTKMYRQVLINPTQRPLQRILWRESPNEPIKVFNLNTVTYGQACASFLSVRCLFELAEECKDKYPDIAEIIKDDFYMDDFLSGFESVERGAYICENVSKILKGGCFELRKWFSNNPSLLKNINNVSNDPFHILSFGSDENAHTLGLIWSCHHDSLMFNVNKNEKETRVTKRTVLSQIARIFDPLGLLAPSIIIAKIMLQKLWAEQISWDCSLPASLYTSWVQFRDELSCLNELRIPRHVVCDKPVLLELHGFSDASKDAYGASVYIKSQNEEGKILVRLFCAKGKVAPVRILTIPKLELCAAFVLSKLVAKVIGSIKLKFSRIVLWSDSTIVLGWLKAQPSALKTFVGNRVSIIQSLTSEYEWRHVPSEDNPSDKLSRGVFPSKIVNLEIWWNGPGWLKNSDEFWPVLTLENKNLPELRTESRVLVAASKTDNTIFEKYSSFSKLCRVTAWILRFINNCKGVEKSIGTLKSDEINSAINVLVRLCQKVSFQQEYDNLQNKVRLNNKSRLIGLNPFLDLEGVIRVGGRLRNSKFDDFKKYPIVICAKHRFSKLLFESEHLRLLHGGPQLLLSAVREKYWPILGRNSAKSTVNKCVKCYRFNPTNVKPIMGDLPEGRLVPAQVFNIVGVDYAGPFPIKDRKGRGAKVTKCYVSLFVCFSTKALHLELVTDLSTECFILALRRFVSRRGKPGIIYSDNGLNFVGANHELKELGSFLQRNQSEIRNECTNQGIQWVFIPAHSPHFGGLWEAGVRSTKYHLKRVATCANLTFEELYTLLTQIESVLNSRPLSPLSSDPNDLHPLTPAHFLLGKSFNDVPDPDVRHIPESRLSNYQRIQQIKQHFWERWSKEYISELQQRTKWKTNYDSLKDGTLVLVKEDNQPPSSWRMGRIIRVHTGGDGVNRVATIRTGNGVIKRAFPKICPLPIDT